ncbi:MAG: hypothetical protein LBK55_00215 [Azoarcus sp.]|jgi:hypothetical protein|nr:hypothetical protein [Azoarcus sp.]
MEAKLKHLEMIQAIVTRMASNSFWLKGWSLTLVAALLGLFTEKAGAFYPLIAAFLCCIMFWVLDGFFLRQERLFRALYNDVAKKQPEDIDFSMDTRPYRTQAGSWARVCVRTTLALFHGVVLASILALLVFALRDI